MGNSYLLEKPEDATWTLLADGEARPSLPNSSRLERHPGLARFHFCLELNHGEKLGAVGFVRAETGLDAGAVVDDAHSLFLSLVKTDALFRITVYLRSAASDLDLQYVTELSGPHALELVNFQFVKWGSPVQVSAGERARFLAGVNRFGLQIARSRQEPEFRERPFAGEFGLEGPVGIITR